MRGFAAGFATGLGSGLACGIGTGMALGEKSARDKIRRYVDEQQIDIYLGKSPLDADEFLDAALGRATTGEARRSWLFVLIALGLLVLGGLATVLFLMR